MKIQNVKLHINTDGLTFLQRNTALQHCCDVVSNCFNIATLCCAKNRRCESSRVTSPLASEGSDDANLGTRS